MVKDILRGIKSKWFQFIAIMLITALGVGFLAGLRVTGHDMRSTMDSYMNDTGMLNLEFRHTLGVDEAMIQELKDLTGQTVVGVDATDTFINIGDTQTVARVIALDTQTEKDLTLLEGTMPTQPGEVVVDQHFNKRGDLKIGDSFNLVDGEIFKGTSLKVVGIANSSLYLNYERGSTPKGSGKIAGFVYGLALDKKVDVFTTARLMMDSAIVSDIEKLVESKAEELSKSRAQRIASPMFADLAKAQSELDQKRDEAKAGFETQSQALDDAKQGLDQAKANLENGIQEVANGLGVRVSGEDYQANINTLKQTIDAKKSEKAPQLQNQLQQSQTQLAGVEASLKRIDDLGYKVAQLQRAYNMAQTDQEKAAIQSELVPLRTQFIQAKGQVASLTETQTKLKEAIQSLQAASQEIDQTFSGATQGVDRVQQGLNQYLAGLATWEAQTATYKSSYESVYTQLDQGQKQINEQQEKLYELNTGKQYVFDRDGVVIGYAELFQDSNRIEAIGRVFPLIFFGVAVLVTLSTMTRMVDESRSEIGVYKALGYSWFVASLKFIGFAFFSWLFGAILGMVFGFYIIPSLIYDAYRIMYQTPALYPSIIWSYAWLPLIMSFVSSVGVAFVKSMRVSRQRTANLLRPPLPKGGQRIVLERITPLWNRLSFLYKVSLRNLFRNKTRFLMTIIGIGGCTGLLITGFGLKNSIYSIIDKQFDTIIRYDGILNYENSVDLSGVALDSHIYVASQPTDVNGLDVKLMTADSIADLQKYIGMFDRKSKTDLSIPDDQVVITEKLAILQKLKVGDDIVLQINERNYTFKIGGIAENYVGHNVYMSRSAYRAATGKMLENNVVLFNTQLDHDSVSSELLKQDNVYNVSFLRDSKSAYSDMMGNFDIVIYVISGSAFALELIVLLNLISMNMSERQKELATLKVLGFYPKELALYVMRENVLMTLVAVVLGVGFGYGLHQFVITAAELDGVMFNRELQGMSIILAVILTFALSVLINLVMSRKANHVNMSEALKTFDE